MISRRHSPLSEKECLDQLCELKQLKLAEEAVINSLRYNFMNEREDRISCEQTAQAEKSLRRECEEQIVIYKEEVHKLKESLTSSRLRLEDREILVEDLRTKLNALESIVSLVSPDVASSAFVGSQLSSSHAGGESLSAISEERDFLQQENSELRTKLLEERKRSREEKDRLEKQIAQYNLFLMMGASNNPVVSANSPNSSPARATTSKVDTSIYSPYPMSLPSQDLLETTS